MNGTNHFLHFVITVFFFPWVIVWILCYFKNEEKAHKRPKRKETSARKVKKYDNWPK